MKNRTTLKRLAVGSLMAIGWQLAIAQDIPRFAIERYEIVGNTLLQPDALERTLAPFKGEARDFGDVQRAIEALETAYREAGFTTVSVLLPEQALEQGIVRLQIIEARIRNIEIAGNVHRDPANIRAGLPQLQEGEVPLVDDVSAALRVNNENPSKKIVLSFSPGERPQDLDARLRVEDDKPYTLGATADNTGTDDTGRRRIGVSYQHSNLWNRDHVLSLQYQTSVEKPEDVQVYFAAYRIPLYRLGDTIDFYAVKSSVNAGNIATGAVDVAISGAGRVFGARYTMNLKRAGDYEHSLGIGLERKFYDNSTVASGLQLGNRLTVNPLLLQYQGRLLKADSETGFSLGITRNIPGGNYGAQSDFDQARSGADKNYSLVRGSASYSQIFAGDWQWRAALSAQTTDQPLVPGEQFGVVGANAVRGFLEREVAGDRGYVANLELYTPDLCGAAVGRCRLLAFADAGGAKRLEALPGEISSEKVSSAGFGLRWSFDRNVSVAADYARVLNSGGTQDSGDWMLHARIGLLY